MQFIKMHGAGNDYVYVDCFRETVSDPAALARAVSPRRFSVGSDGLVLVCPSDRADFRMRIFNADGSEAEMCGNGIRCVGKYVYERGLTDKKEIAIETLAGIRQLELRVENGKVHSVRVDMGRPRLERSEVPMLGPEGTVIDEHLDVLDTKLAVTCLSMGNPHCVTFVDRLDEFPVERLGPAIENLSVFPQRTNVEFASVLSPASERVRVWERGSGETYACGTGACAVCVAAVLAGRGERRMEVHLRGGTVEVEWPGPDESVFLTGPAEEVYRGSLVI